MMFTVSAADAMGAVVSSRGKLEDGEVKGHRRGVKSWGNPRDTLK